MQKDNFSSLNIQSASGTGYVFLTIGELETAELDNTDTEHFHCHGKFSCCSAPVPTVIRPRLSSCPPSVSAEFSFPGRHSHPFSSVYLRFPTLPAEFSGAMEPSGPQSLK